MSEVETVPRRGKLPPLTSENNETNSLERTRRKKIPKSTMGDSTDRSTPRRTLPQPSIQTAQTSQRRPPSSARSRPESEAESEAPPTGRDIPPRPKPKKPRSQLTQDSRTDRLEDIEGDEVLTPRPKKKKKIRQVTESNEELVSQNGDLPTDRSGQPKKKKKKKVDVMGSAGLGLEAELYELEDDVITESTDSIEENKYGTPAVMRSEPINKVFIEQKSGFKTANKDKLARKRANQQQRALNIAETKPAKSTIQFAISSHRVFKTFVLFLQGLLAGICIWQILTVYLLANQGYDILLKQYQVLAMPVQCMYYFLFAISTVAVFDKNDIARPTKPFIRQSVAMQTTAISCLFYLVGLVISLATAFLDDKINMYTTDPIRDDLWPSEQARDAELKKWVVLNLVRGLMPILGWLVISISPKSDRLIENLEKADENIIEGLEITYMDTEAGIRANAT